MVNIKDNISYVREILYVLAKRFGRDSEEIRLVCVTKETNLSQINEAIEANVTDFGENRVQEAKGKIISIDKPVRWHMIGHLQRNRVKETLRLFDFIQSIDSIELADVINLEAKRLSKTVDILVQVNTSGETSKFGIGTDEAVKLISHILTLKYVRLLGLMTIAPFSDNAEDSRGYFTLLKKLAEELKKQFSDNINMGILSMGMSSDFEVAVEEGSNMVRIGTLIFKSDTEIVKERLKCISRD